MQIADFLRRLKSASTYTQMLHIESERCVGCGACVAACRECETHKGMEVINLISIERNHEEFRIPLTCMHCRDAPCIKVCTGDAIKKVLEGIVTTPDVSKCLGCQNCILICPFGAPRFEEAKEITIKCDLCLDRIKRESLPLCIAVCPSDAITVKEPSDISLDLRKRRVTMLVKAMPIRA